MSKKVTIPTCANPFEVIVNGVRYRYPAGETIEVPDDVAVVIEKHIATHQKKPERKFSGTQPDWNQNDSTAPDYVKNRTHYEKVSPLISISLADCVVEDHDPVARCTLPFAEEVDVNNIKVELVVKSGGVSVVVPETAIEATMDTESGTWYVGVDYWDEDAGMGVGCALENAVFDNEKEEVVVDGNVRFSCSAYNEGDEYLPIEEFTFKFSKIEIKKIDKRLLDIPEVVTNVFAVKFDWNTNEWTADYNAIGEAYDKGQTIVLMDQSNYLCNLSRIDSDSAIFTRFKIGLYNLTGKMHIHAYTTTFKNDGTVESDVVIFDATPVS